MLCNTTFYSLLTAIVFFSIFNEIRKSTSNRGRIAYIIAGFFIYIICFGFQFTPIGTIGFILASAYYYVRFKTTILKNTTNQGVLYCVALCMLLLLVFPESNNSILAEHAKSSVWDERSGVWPRLLGSYICRKTLTHLLELPYNFPQLIIDIVIVTLIFKLYTHNQEPSEK